MIVTIRRAKIFQKKKFLRTESIVEHSLGIIRNNSCWFLKDIIFQKVENPILYYIYFILWLYYYYIYFLLYLQIHFCNDMKWHATHIENILSQNCNIFSVLSIFKYNTGKTNDKFISLFLSLLLLNHFYPVISHRRVSKRKRRIIVCGSVTRYGPQSVASASS